MRKIVGGVATLALLLAGCGSNDAGSRGVPSATETSGLGKTTSVAVQPTEAEASTVLSPPSAPPLSSAPRLSTEISTTPSSDDEETSTGRACRSQLDGFDLANDEVYAMECDLVCRSMRDTANGLEAPGGGKWVGVLGSGVYAVGLDKVKGVEPTTIICSVPADSAKWILTDEDGKVLNSGNGEVEGVKVDVDPEVAEFSLDGCGGLWRLKY